jgi:RNA polymerase sigma factor for flagellar operon FliA
VVIGKEISIAKHPCRPRTTHAPDPQQEDQDQSLVRLIAWQIFSRVPKHASVELTDVLQAGHLGLLRARASYRRDSEVPFAVYARYRIRGEILDMLRRLDSAPRSLRRWQRTVENKSRDLSMQLQRTPTDEEIGASLGTEIEKIRKNRQALLSVSMDNELPRRADEDANPSKKEWTASPDWMPDVIQERRESLRILMDSIAALPPRSRQVVVLYYQRDYTMKQIGEVLRVNESRVSQIHKTALQTMSGVLQSAGISHTPVYKLR